MPIGRSRSRTRPADLGLDIVVVANHHRRPLVLDHLKTIPHRLSFTADVALGDGFRPSYSDAEYNQLGAYRCFVGHQSALKLAGRGPVLVLEDDAVPIADDWLELACAARPWLESHEVVSLHGRSFDRSRLVPLGVVRERELFAPLPDGQNPIPRVLGSLAYLISPAAIARFLTMEYDGLPVDLLLPARFRFGLVDPSPFRHDRSQGTLIG